VERAWLGGNAHKADPISLSRYLIQLSPVASSIQYGTVQYVQYYTMSSKYRTVGTKYSMNHTVQYSCSCGGH
jgi:hypothetical protein